MDFSIQLPLNFETEFVMYHLHMHPLTTLTTLYDKNEYYMIRRSTHEMTNKSDMT